MSLDGEVKSSILVLRLSFPKVSGLFHELRSKLSIPVLLVLVELELLSLGHVSDGDDTIILHRRHLLPGSNGGRHDVLKVVHFMDVLLLVPPGVGLVDENEILVLVVGHLGDVIEVDVIDNVATDSQMGSVDGLDHQSLHGVLHVHVVTVIAVEILVEVNVSTILELARDLEPVEVLREPSERGAAFVLVELVAVEGRASHSGGGEKDLIESGPFEDLSVLIDSLTNIEVKSRVRIHGRGLNEGLELVTGMGRGSLNTENSVKRLLGKNRVSKSVSDMRELLFISPFNIVFGSPISRMIGGGKVSLKFSELLLMLGDIRARNFSESVEVLEVLILEVLFSDGVESRIKRELLKSFRNV